MEVTSSISMMNILHKMQHLQVVHEANFGKPEMKPLELLNLLTECKLCELFPNACISCENTVINYCHNSICFN